MSKLLSFFRSLPPDSQEPADSDAGQPALSPDDLFAQTFKASGYTAGSDPCYDAAWDNYKRCLKSGTLPATCLAQLATDQANCARKQPPGAADSSGLTTVDAAYVSADGGGSAVAAPKLGVEYDLCVKIANRGKVNAPSGPFVVRFDLQGDQLIQKTFQSQADLQVGFSVVAVAHLGTFPSARKYTLVACVADAASPNKNINCTSKTEFVVQGSSPTVPAPQAPAPGFLPDTGSDQAPPMDDIESLVSGAPAAAPAPPPASPGKTQAPSSKDAPQTDDSGLVCDDTVHVSEDGDVDQGMPEPDVDYFFYADFVNGGKLPTGPCVVRFELSGEKAWKDEFDLDDGLKPGEKVRAIVSYGTFPNKFASYHLKACIYSKAAPDKAIACAGEFEITITESS